MFHNAVGADVSQSFPHQPRVTHASHETPKQFPEEPFLFFMEHHAFHLYYLLAAVAGKRVRSTIISAFCTPFVIAHTTRFIPERYL
jgi:hypothetical protein